MKKLLVILLGIMIMILPTAIYTLYTLASTPASSWISYPSSQYNVFSYNNIELTSNTVNIYNDSSNKDLFFTTVIVEEKPSVLQLIVAQMIGEAEIFDESEHTVVVYDIPTTIMEYYENEMDVSLKFALASALDYLKIPYKSSLDIADVKLILEDGTTVNEEYVTLLEINDTKISRFEEVEAYLQALTDDTPVELKIKRINGEVLDMLVTPTFSTTLGRYSLGFYVLPRYKFPIDFSFNVPNVKGGSAGLILSLAAVEKLSKEQILPNLRIGGTGAISSSGEVLEISSLKQKMISGFNNNNEVFLFPASMCSKDLPEYSSMILLPVTTLEDAITQLHNVVKGKRYATCQDYLK